MGMKSWLAILLVVGCGIGQALADEFPARYEYGRPVVSAHINNAFVDMTIDTGATRVTLTYEDAMRAGLSVRESDFNQKTITANGTTNVARVRIDQIRIGTIVLKGVDTNVCKRGTLHRSLLGMSFISRLHHIELHPNKVILVGDYVPKPQPVSRRAQAPIN